MYNSEKLHGALGLARRAGKCLTGDFAVERAIKSGKVALIVLDATVSDSTRERYRALCTNKGLPYVESDGIGHAIGKSGIKIIGIHDKRFVEMIMRVLDDQECEKNKQEVLIEDR